jgi:hypothetical protein
MLRHTSNNALQLVFSFQFWDLVQVTIIHKHILPNLAINTICKEKKIYIFLIAYLIQRNLMI